MLLELMLIDSNVVISAALCQEYMFLGLLVYKELVFSIH